VGIESVTMSDAERAQPDRGDTVVLSDGRVGVVRSVRQVDAGDPVIVVLLADDGTTADVTLEDVAEVHRPA
jgi:preprotein translocase subunit YajC